MNMFDGQMSQLVYGEGERRKVMITLKKVTVHKFKCIESDQTFEVDPDITVLVGMNESGKTSVLQALAKTRYFTKDPAFTFSTTHDFPRKEKKRMDKSGVVPKAVTCTYAIAKELVEKIGQDIGPETFTSADIVQHVTYKNRTTWNPPPVVDAAGFIAWKTKQLGISSKTLDEKLAKARSLADLDAVIAEYKEDDLVAKLKTLRCAATITFPQ